MCILITEVIEFNSMQGLGFLLTCFLATDGIVRQKQILKGKNKYLDTSYSSELSSNIFTVAVSIGRG